MMTKNRKLILIRGGGDLASGAAAVLHRNGWQVIITELPEPRVVRRKVAFAEAVWDGQQQVEEIHSVLAKNDDEIASALLAGKIPVIVDPDAILLETFDFAAVVDARMIKRFNAITNPANLPIIGLGPGFVAGENCDVVIETNRGENLGRIIRQGSPEQDTGIPGSVHGWGIERVLYSPCEGIIRTLVEIGELVEKGQLLAEVGGTAVIAPFDGLVRGMLRDGLRVREHLKIGDIDPRKDLTLATSISDKALVIGESVLKVVESLQ
jgi:xanthine dehydrogenase accessory factor